MSSAGESDTWVGLGTDRQSPERSDADLRVHLRRVRARLRKARSFQSESGVLPALREREGDPAVLHLRLQGRARIRRLERGWLRELQQQRVRDVQSLIPPGRGDGRGSVELARVSRMAGASQPFAFEDGVEAGRPLYRAQCAVHRTTLAPCHCLGAGRKKLDSPLKSFNMNFEYVIASDTHDSWRVAQRTRWEHGARSRGTGAS